VNLAAGCDYNALILATQEGRAATIHATDGRSNPGLQGQFSVKFLSSSGR
jgi:hypothetical protein